MPLSPPIEVTDSCLETIPDGWHLPGLKGVLIGENLLQERVSQLAEAIRQTVPPRQPLVVLALLSGAYMFTADLVRRLQGDYEIDFLGVSSYGSGTQSGDLRWTHPMQTELRDKHVIVIDDILDTGQTLNKVTSKLQTERPASIRSCVLLEKRLPTQRPCPFDAEWIGFRIPPLFVVGYGLDFGLRFRQLPFIGILDCEDHERGTD